MRGSPVTRARAGRRRGLVCTHDAQGVAYFANLARASEAIAQLRPIWPDVYYTRTARGFIVRRFGSSESWTGSRWIAVD